MPAWPAPRRRPTGRPRWALGRSRALLAAALAVAILVVGGVALLPRGQEAESDVSAMPLRVPVGAEPDGAPVELDADLYLPPEGTGAAPAVLLAHGFGGDKGDLAGEARRLVAAGYVVLVYTARGFGASGGRIHLNDPDFEIADARALIDVLAGRGEVTRDGDGDPRVAIVGGSYGGALALMAGSVDRRVDAVVASITWNDLAAAFFPQHLPASPTPGPFKQLWASAFFATAVGSVTGAAAEAGGGDPRCGRFDPEVCRPLLEAAETGRASDGLLALLRAHSPAPLLGSSTPPTLLIQGMSDTLFGIEHAQATARALESSGVPVAMRWFNGGHDGTGTSGSGSGARAASAEVEAQRRATTDWLAANLGAAGPLAMDDPLPVPALAYSLPWRRGEDAARGYTVTHLAEETTILDLAPSAGEGVVSPPGGAPAAVTVVPGLGGPLAAVSGSYQLAALAGQHVAFDTETVAETTVVAGSPRIRLRLTSTAAEATLYLSLWQIQGGGGRLVRPLVGPVRLAAADGLSPGRPVEVDVALPAATWELTPGSRWRVLVSATDQAYRNPTTARVDRIELADASLRLPVAAGTAVAGPGLLDTETVALGAALIAVLLLGLAGAVRARVGRPRPARRTEDTDVPLVVTGLTKRYADGHLAVDDVTWRAERGQVVGLLGPNGAGKTTTLRMATGLIHPDAGSVHILGEPLTPGAPVLGRVGTLIEGPGFLPHLSGRENLAAYWAATGRPADEARTAEAVDVAALGDALDRPVRTYSHGMRQRLGIAQAMLGLPDVLILDEPTNGLDPPQIAALRPILRRYAAGGRTVVVSSHLLGEVELTCSHVVVMHAGRVVAAGSVGEVGVAEGRSLEEVFLATIAGVGARAPDPHGEAADDRTERLRQVRPR